MFMAIRHHIQAQHAIKNCAIKNWAEKKSLLTCGTYASRPVTWPALVSARCAPGTGEAE